MSLLLPKDTQHRDPEYIKFLHTEPCLFTGHMGCDPMHIGTAGKGPSAGFSTWQATLAA